MPIRALVNGDTLLYVWVTHLSTTICRYSCAPTPDESPRRTCHRDTKEMREMNSMIPKFSPMLAGVKWDCKAGTGILNRK
jgi:hypothetical protein